MGAYGWCTCFADAAFWHNSSGDPIYNRTMLSTLYMFKWNLLLSDISAFCLVSWFGFQLGHNAFAYVVIHWSTSGKLKVTHVACVLQKLIRFLEPLLCKSSEAQRNGSVIKNLRRSESLQVCARFSKNFVRSDLLSRWIVSSKCVFWH